MAAVDFGQYAHSNQPSHHILYMYAMAGRPDRTQYWVRRTLTELYTPDNFAGDEDTGAMAAWYVLSALGFYPLCPGRPWYVLGSPLFEEATLHLPNEIQTRIVARNQAPDHCFVRSCRLNGQTVTGVTIPHSSLASGGELEFSMQPIVGYKVTSS
jgi:putative alpha-1,2-mannosidase